jgi:hypothetical protein
MSFQHRRPWVAMLVTKPRLAIFGNHFAWVIQVNTAQRIPAVQTAIVR